MAHLTLKFVTDVFDHDYEVVEFHGELDQSTLPDAEQQLTALIEKYDRSFLILDLSDLGFINSEGIGFFLTTNKKLSDRNKKLIVCGVQAHVADVVKVMGLSDIIPVYQTINETINAIKKNT